MMDEGYHLRIGRRRAIISQEAHFAGIAPEDITGPRRFKHIVEARDCVAWRLRNELKMSYTQIGQVLGGRDHTTALASVRRFKKHFRQPRPDRDWIFYGGLEHGRT